MAGLRNVECKVLLPLRNRCEELRLTSLFLDNELGLGSVIWGSMGADEPLEYVTDGEPCRSVGVGLPVFKEDSVDMRFSQPGGVFSESFTSNVKGPWPKVCSDLWTGERYAPPSSGP